MLEKTQRKHSALHGVFISFLTISPIPAQTYHFHVCMSLSRPTIPIKSILAYIFHYKDQIQEKWFVKFWWYQRTSAVLGHSLQEKSVILIIDFVTVQQLRCGCQQGSLGLVSSGGRGSGLVTAGPTRLHLENIRPGL